MDYLNWHTARALLADANAGDWMIVDDFPCYAYVLLNQATSVQEFAHHLPGIHEATGEYVRVLAPPVPLQYAAGSPLNAKETSRALAQRFFLNSQGERVDVTDRADSFAYDVESGSYEMAEILAIPRQAIPGVAMLPTLRTPSRCLLWRLSTTDPMVSLRASIDHATDAAKRAVANQSDVLDAVRDALESAGTTVKEHRLTT